MFHPKPGGLRNPGDRFWHDILQQSKAKIHAKNNTFAALSPGSNPGLFMFDPLFSGSLFHNSTSVDAQVARYAGGLNIVVFSKIPDPSLTGRI